MARNEWTAEQDAVLRERFGDTAAPIIAGMVGRSASAVYSRAIMLGLKRPPEVYERLKQERRARARPKPVMPVDADGKRRKPHWVPVGSERISRRGYVFRKVSDTGIKEVDWQPAHLCLWVEAHGPVPSEHKVVFRDGNPKNLTPENLELITNAEAMRRNSIQRYPKEIRRTAVQLGRFLAKLKRLEQQHEKPE
ncbi:MAG TPA: HNH endonuclease signature motif containing protein [Pseudomonas sp.]